jgi:hypothetical protein
MTFKDYAEASSQASLHTSRAKIQDDPIIILTITPLSTNTSYGAFGRLNHDVGNNKISAIEGKKTRALRILRSDISAIVDNG